MTIQKEAPGVWFLTCDRCQDRVELDTDPDEPFLCAVEEAKQIGYRIYPENHGGKVVWFHVCRDCIEDSAAHFAKENDI